MKRAGIAFWDDVGCTKAEWDAIWSKPNPLINLLLRKEAKFRNLNPGWMSDGLMRWMDSFDSWEIRTLDGALCASSKRFALTVGEK